MGASVIPAASTAQANWVELASATPTSGSTVSFTGLTEYRNYKVSYYNLFTTGGTNMLLRFNNDNNLVYAWITQGDSGSVNSSAYASSFPVHPSVTDTDGASGVITIADANQVIKNTTYYATKNGTGTDAINGQAFWNNTAVINRMDFIISSVTFTGGTFKVYGSN